MPDIIELATAGPAREQLAPNGILTAGINLGNPLLVTGQTVDGEADGIAPDVARAVAAALGVECRLQPFKRPGETADAAAEGCGIVLIAHELERAKSIAFSPGYVEIEATYLVKGDAGLVEDGDVDQPGVEVVVSERSAYDLFLARHLRQATLSRHPGIPASEAYFLQSGAGVLAGLRPALLDTRARLPGSWIKSEGFLRVQQAIGTAAGNDAGAAFLRDFVTQATANGTVSAIVRRHKVAGLTVPGSPDDL